MLTASISRLQVQYIKKIQKGQSKKVSKWQKKSRVTMICNSGERFVARRLALCRFGGNKCLLRREDTMPEATAPDVAARNMAQAGAEPTVIVHTHTGNEDI